LETYLVLKSWNFKLNKTRDLRRGRLEIYTKGLGICNPQDPSIFLEGLKMQKNQVDRSKNQKIVEGNPLAFARGLLVPLLFSFSS
jgi:hypothetical protein